MKQNSLTIIALATMLALPLTSSSYDCTDQDPICSPNWTQLTYVSCATGPNGKCCIKKTFSYTCTEGGEVHQVVNAWEYSGEKCQATLPPPPAMPIFECIGVN